MPPTIRQVCLGNKWARVKKVRKSPVPRLQGCPQKKGIVTKIRIVTPKKPNSARRKIAKLRLSNKLMIRARVTGQGHPLQAYSRVLVRGGRANDLPGIRYTMIRGCYDFTSKEDFLRIRRHSKYGINLDVLKDRKAGVGDDK